MNKGFKLYFIDNSGIEILISDYVNSKSVLTFNESIVEEENSKYTLNFEIFKNYEGVEYLDLTKFLRIGRKLKLELFSPDKTILFIITSISPESTEENIKWVISAEDYASYIFNKNNIGLHLDTIEDEDFNKWFEEKTNTPIPVSNTETPWTYKGEFISNFSLFLNENLLEEKIDYTYTTKDKELTINFISPITGPEEIIIKRNVIAKDIMQYILERGYLYNSSDLKNSWKIADNDSLTLENNPLYQQINISISDSNTYNALIETALLTKSFLVIDYNSKQIGLIRKNDESFRKNYLLSPNFNLQDFSLNYNSESFYPILYVTGGSDEFDIAVTMMPYLTFQQYKDMKNFFEGKRKVTRIMESDGNYSFDIFPIKSGTDYSMRLNGDLVEEDDSDNPWNIIDDNVTINNLTIGDKIEFSYESETSPNFDSASISSYYEDPNFYEEVDWYREPEDDTISILNYLVYLDSFIINLDYFKKNFLIEDSDFNEIINRIYNELRIINWEYQQIIYKKNMFEKYIYDIESKLENYTDRLVLNETTDYKELNNEINSIYLKEGGYEAQSTLQNNEITSTAIFANTGRTYEWVVQWGHIFYQVERAIYEELENTSGYEKWIDGDPVYNKRIYEDSDNDIYYVSAPIKSSAPPYVIDLNLPGEPKIYEIKLKSKNTVYEFDGELDYSASTNYRYKWNVTIPESFKSFDENLISNSVYRWEYQKKWENDYATSLGNIGLLRVYNPSSPFAVRIIPNAQKSNYPTVERSLYDAETKKIQEVPFPNTDEYTGWFYGKFSPDPSIFSVDNTTDIIQIQEYIHHVNEELYYMVLRQINNYTAQLDVYDETFSFRYSKTYSIPYTATGNFIEFQVTDMVDSQRYIVISHHRGIGIWDISGAFISIWPETSVEYYNFGRPLSNASFIAMSDNTFYRWGNEINYQFSIYFINQDNQLMLLRKPSASESFSAQELKHLPGSYYDIECDGSNLYFLKVVNGYFYITRRTLENINDNETTIAGPNDSIKKIHFHRTTQGKNLLIYNRKGGADISVIALEGNKTWYSSSTLGNLGYVKDIVVKGNLIYAFGEYNHSGNKKDRVVIYNIEEDFASTPNWSQDPTFSYEQPPGAMKTITARSAMDYKKNSISYDNYLVVVHSTTPIIMVKEFYNYPKPTAYPDTLNYPMVYFDQETRESGYSRSSWEIDEDDYTIIPRLLTLKKQNLLYNTQYVDLLYVSMNYFDLLRQYKGTNYLLEKEKKLKKQLIDAIKEKDKILEEISLTSDEDPNKLNLESELKAYRAGVGTWTYNKKTDTFGYEEIEETDSTFGHDGKYSLLYSNFKYYREYYDSSTVFTNVTYENSVYGNYERIKKEKEEFWFNIKRDYGEFLQEGFYENEIESNSFNLYKQGIQNIADFNHPTEEYSLTYLDGSDLLGANIDLIQVGDFIKINLENLGVMDEERNEVQVYSIQRELRDLSNISLTVGKVNRNTTLVEKIIASLNKK